LSVRVAGRLGYGYLPTRSVGEISRNSSPEILREARQERYQTLARAALSALQLGANLVVDGGFMTRRSRAQLLDHLDPQNTVIVNCLCADEHARMKRLVVRAMDPVDYENQSAKEILRDDNKTFSVSPQDLPDSELAEGRVCAILDVDTLDMTVGWRGNPPPELSVKLPEICKELLEEYSGSQDFHSFDVALRSHFDELADEYDGTTEWRSNDQLLKSLHRTLPAKPARVLDIGAGTGLASEWYTRQGHHVTGVDISPMMLRKAAERLTLTVLGDATTLPFVDDYFDLVVIRQCLHYVNPNRLLSSVRRKLRRDGALVISSAVTVESAKTLWQEFKAVTQPLRLRVFTTDEICRDLSENGFRIEECIDNKITRRETLSSLESRAAVPHGGWNSFLRNAEKIANNIAPELQFSFHGDVIEYKQSWVTIWAKPEGS
jgi:ubiquinone/menaquinone biosynthesis C-methylase UbiE